MLLVIDIGNTNAVIGLFEKDNLMAHWRLASQQHRTADEYGIMIKEFFLLNNIDISLVTGVIISCVVPPLLPVLKEMSQKYLKTSPLILGSGTKTGITIKYENPRDVGADRIANAVAGYERFGGPLIIVDFGTAITFDVILKNREYIGGLIFPGLSISLEALFTKAARLQRVELIEPKKVIGVNTEESIQAGAVYGFASLVDGIVEKIQKEIGKEALVIATGGQAGLIAKYSSAIKDVCPLLTLEGLKIIYEKNIKLT
jgi:type III pantothenate kinase